jgi:hypothetical protein
MISMSIDRQNLHSLISTATPFIRITSAERESWCRVMKDENDGRIGPWDFVATFEVLDDSTWKRKGEVIYFVTDNSGVLRLVGQSMSKLNGRWKTVPMSSTTSKQRLNRKALFHTSSWPAIESGLRAAEPPPFTVSALFRPELERLCRSAKGSLNGCLDIPETHPQRLSYHVETWVCELDHRPNPLWNKDKVPHVYRGA